MPIAIFSEPFLTRKNGQLIPDLNRSFFLTVKLGRKPNELLANVGGDGRARLDWVVDHDGQFFEMTSLGLASVTLFNLIGLTRRKELLKIEEPRLITVGELATRIDDMKDRFAEARFAAQTRRLLRKYPEDRLIDRDIMIDLLSE